MGADRNQSVPGVPNVPLVEWDVWNRCLIRAAGPWSARCVTRVAPVRSWPPARPSPGWVTAIVSARGSVGVISNRNDSISVALPPAIGTLIANPSAASTQTRRSTIQITARASRPAPCGCRFRCPPGHGVGHGAVESSAGNHQGEDRKGGAQPGEHDFLVDGLIDLGGLGLDVGHRHPRVRVADDLADRGDQAQRVAIGSHANVACSRSRGLHLRQREIGDRRHVVLESAVLRGRGDADDFQIARPPVPAAT